MQLRTSLSAIGAVSLLAASVFASAGGSEPHPELGAHAIVLHVPAHATDAERLELLQADFDRRQYRIDWKSDSVVKRVRWALQDARRALADGDADVAAERLGQAQRLLERY